MKIIKLVLKEYWFVLITFFLILISTYQGDNFILGIIFSFNVTFSYFLYLFVYEFIEKQYRNKKNK